MKANNAITDVPGIEVGQAQDEQALTGCTVVLCRKGAVGGVDVRGSAPGTRETDLLNPVNLVDKVHAVVLAGGSAFGLDAASGVMKYLAERKIGFGQGANRVPIVPAAILYDLGLTKPPATRTRKWAMPRQPPQGLERLAAEIQRLALAQGLMRPQAKAPAEPPLPALPAQPGTPARSYRRDKTTL